jgi:hypothetical protein
MSDRSASLLTKTQRRRIRSDFDELDEQKRRRDERQIRERLAAGLLDFRVLAEYPDSQFELVVEELSEDERHEALVNATLMVERLRALSDIDRERVLLRARERADDLSRETSDVRSLDDLNLRTETEIRTETRAAVSEQFETNPWDERADRLLKLAAGASIPLVGLLVVNSRTPANLFGTSALAAVVLYLCLLVVVATLSAVFLVKAAQALKYDVLPAARQFRRNPTGVIARVLDALRRPGERLRQMWEEL